VTAHRRRLRPVVVKFGGASLGEPNLVAALVRSLRARRTPVVVVASAREGITDLLEEAIAHPRDEERHRRLIRRIEGRHPALPPGGVRQVERLGTLLASLRRSGKADGPLADRLRSMGERIGVHWLAARLRESGLAAVPVEADHLGLITDNAYGASCILFDRSRPGVTTGLGRLLVRGEVPVVTGYFGRSLEGRVATLGRGGSDYAAAGIGLLVGASRVVLVKRNVAVLSADPKEVADARPIPELSYEEAEELAQFGARVLHPLTIEPARAGSVVLQVRSLDDPQIVTTIGPGRAGRRNRAITVLRPLKLLRLRVAGGRQRPGVVAEVAHRLADARVNLVQLFTSSALLCLLLVPAQASLAVRALRPLARDAGAEIEGPADVALVTVIGDGVLDDLDRLPSDAVAGAEGMSATPRALSLAVPDHRRTAVVRSIHRALVRGGRR
jgi:aspartate kinase